MRERKGKRAEEEGFQRQEKRGEEKERKKKIDVVRREGKKTLPRQLEREARCRRSRHALERPSSLAFPSFGTKEKHKKLTARSEVVPELVDVVAVLLVSEWRGDGGRQGQFRRKRESRARHALDSTPLLLAEEKENRPFPPPPPLPLRPVLVSHSTRHGQFKHFLPYRMPIETAESANTEGESPHMRKIPSCRAKKREGKKNSTSKRKKPPPSCSPCRRLGAEGTAYLAPRTQKSMSGPGSRPAEGARAAGARPGVACRRPFFQVESWSFFFPEGEREKN